jgi:hypothetical protein
MPKSVKKPPAKPPKARTYDMGTSSGVDLDKARSLAAALEDKEIVRKLALRR